MKPTRLSKAYLGREDQSIVRQASRLVTNYVVPLVIVLIAANLLYTLIYIRMTIATYEQTSSFFLDEIDTGLEETSLYMARVAAEDLDFDYLAESPDMREYDIHKRRLYLTLAGDIDFYRTVQYFFIYQPEREDIILVPSSDPSFQRNDLRHEELKQTMKDYLDDGNLTFSSWRIVSIKDKDYLTRLLSYNQIYFGALVPIEAMTDRLSKYQLDNSRIEIAESDTLAPRTHRLEKGTMSFILSSRTGDFAMHLRIPSGSFFRLYLPVYLVTLLFSLLLLVFIPVSRNYIRREIEVPLDTLVGHMDRIRSGELNAVLNPDIGGKEMRTAAETLNTMVGEIKRLEGEIYDEKLREQDLKMECLNLQLNPHFFLNTLNYIYVLAGSGQTEELRKIILDFSSYFRSIFRFSEGSLIHLFDEIERCRSYSSIYEIRLSRQIDVEYRIPAELYDILVPSMCVLTFVENSIKHARSDIDSLRIVVEAAIASEDGEEWLELSISDNGKGYSEKTLREFSEKEVDQMSENGHIGILNLRERLRLIYDGRAVMTLLNEETGGAAVRLRLPVLPDDTSGETPQLPV